MESSESFIYTALEIRLCCAVYTIQKDTKETEPIQRYSLVVKRGSGFHSQNPKRRNAKTLCLLGTGTVLRLSLTKEGLEAGGCGIVK